MDLTRSTFLSGAVPFRLACYGALLVFFAAAEGASAQKIQPDGNGGPGWTQTETSVSSSGSPSIYLTSVTFTVGVFPATCSSYVPITIYDNGAYLASVTLNSQGSGSYTTSSLAVGSHSITASFPGNIVNGTQCLSSTSSPITQIVNQVPVIASSTPSSVPAGAQGSFTVSGMNLVDSSGGITVSITGGISASVANATSTHATISFSIPSTLSPGTQSITISNGLGTSAPFSFNVAAAGAVATTTVLSSSLNPSVYGQSVILSANVTAAGGASPDGTVAYFDGSLQLGSGTLQYGNAAFTTYSLSPGTHSLTATYQGNSSFSPSTSIALSQVIQQVVTMTSVTLSPSTAAPLQPIVVTIDVTDTVGIPPTGTVNCSATNTSQTFSGSLSSGTATWTRAIAFKNRVEPESPRISVATYVGFCKA